MDPDEVLLEDETCWPGFFIDVLKDGGEGCFWAFILGLPCCCGLGEQYVGINIIELCLSERRRGEKKEQAL